MYSPNLNVFQFHRRARAHSVLRIRNVEMRMLDVSREPVNVLLHSIIKMASVVSISMWIFPSLLIC